MELFLAVRQFLTTHVIDIGAMRAIITVYSAGLSFHHFGVAGVLCHLDDFFPRCRLNLVRWNVMMLEEFLCVDDRFSKVVDIQLLEDRRN